MSEEAVAVEAEAVQSHATNVVTWDVPSAIVAGERFRIKVGVKCTSECSLVNGRFGIFDHEGTHVADGVLPGDVWPNTTGLHAAEIELRAPAEPGLYTWSVKAPVADVGVPHEEGSSTFGVRVVSRPDHRVRVEVVDHESQRPLAGARVVMHPYQAVTDDRGVAELRVAKGTYRLFVSQTRYETFALPLEVTGDMATTAELSVEPVLERN
jgi:hypothetical protein